MNTGKVWKYGDDVNTDVIFPGKYTYQPMEPAEMAEHALEDLDPGFARVVQPGDLIGYVGDTGLVTGAHLHWEMRVGGFAVDPMQWTETAIP